MLYNSIQTNKTSEVADMESHAVEALYEEYVSIYNDLADKLDDEDDVDKLRRMIEVSHKLRELNIRV